MSRITVKTSTVFVSVDRETKIFRSVDEVPPEWRRRFEGASGGLKPQTILIADRKGREEILRSLQGQPSAVQTRWKASNSSTARTGAAGSATDRNRLPVREMKRLEAAAPRSLLSRIHFSGTLVLEAGFVSALAGLLYFAFFHS
jgi:hypothetical protein